MRGKKNEPVVHASRLHETHEYRPSIARLSLIGSTRDHSDILSIPDKELGNERDMGHTTRRPLAL